MEPVPKFLRSRVKKMGNLSYIIGDYQFLFFALKPVQKIDLALYVFLHIHAIQEPFTIDEIMSMQMNEIHQRWIWYISAIPDYSTLPGHFQIIFEIFSDEFLTAEVLNNQDGENRTCSMELRHGYGKETGGYHLVVISDSQCSPGMEEEICSFSFEKKELRVLISTMMTVGIKPVYLEGPFIKT